MTVFFLLSRLLIAVSLHLRQLDFKRQTSIISFGLQLVVQANEQFVWLTHIDLCDRNVIHAFTDQ